MAKAPRPGTTGDKPETTLILDGVKYPFRLAEVTARDSGALRKACGISLRAAVAALKDDPDIDIIAALVWLSRRQNGEPNVSYDEVAEAIGYDTEFAYEGLQEADEDPDSPEA